MVTEFKPTPEQQARHEEAVKAKLEQEIDLAKSWRPVDLFDAIHGVRDAPPTLCARSDGKHLFYAGRMHWIMGEPETLKSWLAQLAVLQAVEEGQQVLYIDYEDHETGVVKRLIDMSSDPEALRAALPGHLHYIRPDSQLGSGEDRITASAVVLDQLLASQTWDLIVLDGVTESMALEGLDQDSNSDVADWLGRLPRRLARTGAAVVVIDHVTKAADGRGRYAIGAQHKLAGLDGAAFATELIAPLARATPESGPIEGKSLIKVNKDRPGWVRSISEEAKVAGTLEITSWPDGKLSVAVTPKVAESVPPVEVWAAVLELLVHLGPRGETSIAEAVELPKPTVTHALAWMVQAGHIDQKQAGNYVRYEATEKGKAEIGGSD